MFAQMMLPHHKQAGRRDERHAPRQGSGVDTDVTDLAKQIKAEQSPEIKAAHQLAEGLG